MRPTPLPASLSQPRYSRRHDRSSPPPPPARRFRTLARGARLGDRLRLLRVAAGLTQTELAGERFSKEYVSQIERGKTRPTAETVEWLAQRLDVDPGFLASGVSTDERGRVEALLARAEALSQGTATTRPSRPTRRRAPPSQPRTRSSSTCAPARARPGRACRTATSATAIELLNGARAHRRGLGLLRRRPRRDRLPPRRLPLQAFERLDRDRAARRGARARRALGAAVRRAPLGHLPLALALPPPPARLRSRARGRRACARARRRASTTAARWRDAYFQASLVAERTGHWVLSRNYAERAKNLFQELDDERTVGRLLNNLGGLSLLLGKPRRGDRAAEGVLRRRRRGRFEGDAAQAIGGLATVHLRLGEWDAGRRARAPGAAAARRPRGLPRRDRPGAARARPFAARARTASTRRKSPSALPTRPSSSSPRSATAPTSGLLSAIWPRAGVTTREAARLYRNAAEALQDMRF